MDSVRPTDVACTASRVCSAWARITLRAALLLVAVASLPGCHWLRPAQPAVQGTLPAPKAVADT
ncbi:MAG: hypothetical protein WCS09_15930, partial [Pseudomonadota bacterium]